MEASVNERMYSRVPVIVVQQLNIERVAKDCDLDGNGEGINTTTVAGE